MTRKFPVGMSTIHCLDLMLLPLGYNIYSLEMGATSNTQEKVV